MIDTTIRLSQERAALGHLKLAKRDIASGDAILGRADEFYQRATEFYRSAAEHMAKAQDKGASQRRIADYLGKSPAWVNRLLRWRKSGHRDTPFGPQSKASRERARVQSAERTKKTKKVHTKEEHEAARAEAKGATDDALRAKAEAIRERLKAEKVYAEARAANGRFDPCDRPIEPATRQLLVKALGMLGSDHVGERAAAALMAEKQRVRLGMTWNELIVNEQDHDDFDHEDLDDDDKDDLDDDDDDQDLDNDGPDDEE